MNAGIGDAVAVGAALDAALEHGAPDPLEAYSAARRPVAEQVVAVTNRLTWLATMDRQARTLRNTVLAMLTYRQPPPGPAALHARLPLAPMPFGQPGPRAQTPWSAWGNQAR
jgi:2-polyprenyl-6-methoxyphenol hydroxylase-like FAD-dependent oxidoreductase